RINYQVRPGWRLTNRFRSARHLSLINLKDTLCISSQLLNFPAQLIRNSQLSL
ncbi:unnamed protein product, partial [Candidula unifasciata]